MKHDEKEMIFDSLIRAKMENYEIKAPEFVFDKIIEQVNVQPIEKKSGRIVFFNFKYVAAAAIIGITLVSSFYLAYKEFNSADNTAVQPVKTDVNPAPVLPEIAKEEPIQNNTPEVPQNKVEKSNIAKKLESSNEHKVTTQVLDNNNVAQHNSAETPQDKAPEIQSHQVDYPVNALKIIPNDQPINEEIKVISPQVKDKKKKK